MAENRYVKKPETHFYYLQSRYYDPNLGRFINADAYASTGQGVLGNNMFAYCRNNPVGLRDVSGYCDEKVLDDGTVEVNPDEKELGAGSGNSGGGVSQATFLPYENYSGHKASRYGTPYSRYTNYTFNYFTGKYEFSTVCYDFAGRQVIRVDWTNHGYSDHGNPHVHIREYNQYYAEGRKLPPLN